MQTHTHTHTAICDKNKEMSDFPILCLSTIALGFYYRSYWRKHASSPVCTQLIVAKIGYMDSKHIQRREQNILYKK